MEAYNKCLGGVPILGILILLQVDANFLDANFRGKIGQDLAI
jgi:hypothetical protein